MVKKTRKLRAAFSLLTALGYKFRGDDAIIGRELESVYDVLAERGYRWSSDLQRWVVMKRGKNAPTDPRKSRYQYVNVSAWVRAVDVDSFVNEWRALADLVEYAVVKTYKRHAGGDSASWARVYMRFRRVV